MRVRLPSRRPIWLLGPNGSGHELFTLAKPGSSPTGALEASRKAALRRYHFDYSKRHDGLSPSASNFKIKYAFLVEFGRHAVLRGQFAFASTGSSPVGRTKYMPYVQAGEEAVLKTVGRKRLAGSNPALPTIYYILGRSQAGKAQDFDSCMLWFESRRPSHFFLVELYPSWLRKWSATPLALVQIQSTPPKFCSCDGSGRHVSLRN